MSGTRAGALRGWKTRTHQLPPVKEERRARKHVYENAPRTRKASMDYVRGKWARGEISTREYDNFRSQTERTYEDIRRANKPTQPRPSGMSAEEWNRAQKIYRKSGRMPTRMNRVQDHYPHAGKRTGRTRAQSTVEYLDARGAHARHKRARGG